MKNSKPKSRFLNLIRRTRKAMKAQIKCVIGADESGMWAQPKRAQLLIFFLLFLALFSNGAQTVTVKQQDGTYTAATKAKTSAAAKDTGKTFVDSKGARYSIYQSEGGSYFVNKVSGKTGKPYKMYLKL